jgi:hypothetical protein
MTTRDGPRTATRLLDPRFRYTPAAATNIAATWKRFGFDPHANEQRRHRAISAHAVPAGVAVTPGTRVLTVVKG